MTDELTNSEPTTTATTWKSRGSNFLRRTRMTRRRLALFLAVVGPGLITSNVDNDAGGISVYTTVGAHFGYTLLWSLIPMTIALYVSEEMCARMGVVTGKGLSDLIREEFGFRSTFFVMIAALAVDLGNTVAEFAGVAASMQIYFRPARGHRRLAAGGEGKLSPSRKNISSRLRLLSLLRSLRRPRKTRLAPSR
jgi:Natural resistance-associated macrophage protein